MRNDKYNALVNSLAQQESVLVAFSGGVDSTLLLKAAKEALGERVLAVTAGSEIYPREEIASTYDLAQDIGVELLEIDTISLETPAFLENPPDRCYHCKKALFGQMQDIAKERGLQVVVDGSNVDDLDDYRPGHKASQELGIVSPLQEVGLTKQEIRDISQQLGLPTWNKASFACLASRFPYGTAVTRERLRQIEQAERVLRELGFRQYRVRYHDALARIEVMPEDLSRAIAERETILSELKKLGFSYVALDLQGYRTGAMNETLKL